MHQLNVLVIGPKSFVHTLNELKPYLKFNFSLDNSSLNNVSINEFDIIFFHRKALDEQYIKDVISKANIIKIAADLEHKLILTNKGREPIYIECLLTQLLL